MAVRRNPAVAALLFALVIAAAVTPLSASTLRVFEGPGCTGRSKVISGCGCFSIANYSGGYKFVYSGGQRAELKVSSNCATREFPEILETDTSSCESHRYRGVRMVC